MYPHKQQELVLMYEGKFRESKFKSSQKFYTQILVPGGTKFFL